MKKNKLTIQVNKPVSDGFAFALNPKNTPKWLDSLVAEETNEWPIKVSSIYRNKNKNGKWNEYVVTALEQDKMFEFVSKEDNYHVRYTYTPIDENNFELEYYEWVDTGELNEAFTQDMLEKFKTILESSK